MVDNNKLTIIKEINNIEHAKSKYFFIGLLLSLIPYILILIVAYKMNVSILFISMILLFMVITSTFNALYLSVSIHNKLITFFENKYECSYKKIKESLI